ncbi:GAD-like domain-containing protein [Ruegeria meonggei]|uniref:GAD-like domain protein n=1 Tax=Ruegeria meonggei TaxID=1446476 RepID=A0A1X7A3E3_9RHOB|nr:GAD-like domain-containing protein [Ruegeria meonggei]SLN69285.1 GAD-like domain protein [Ruegeria meonggei]
MTRKFAFDAFIKTLPKDGPGDALSDGMLEKYGGVVPADLTQHWQAHGLGSYGNRALWFIDPDKIIEEIRRFEGAETAIPFARTALGMVFSLVEEGVVMTFPQSNLTEFSSPNLNVWGFGYFRSPDKNRGILSLDIAEKLEPRLGPVDKDTCYGLKTALALGGGDAPEDYAVVNLAVYLDILASVHAET